jgi:2-furoyl-CoA dehydrogenase large subunit
VQFRTTHDELAGAKARASETFLGKPMERVEDAILLCGRGQFLDDLGVPPATVHASFVRSPHPHARLVDIDVSDACALDGVHAVITGSQIAEITEPFTVGVKAPMKHRSLAVDKVRYQGEPVAIVLADTPYLAEDAAELVGVRYEPIPAVVDPVEATQAAAPLLHEDMDSNVVADRSFRYGEPERVFAEADHECSITIRYPRNSVTPIECFGVLADYHPGDRSYEATSNFQGPFALQPVMALALKVPANRLRLKSPPSSGGSFGTKQGIFPYVVALCAASRIAGRPVKWIEDRLEHLSAATSATNRVTTLKAAFDGKGRVQALDWDQVDDCGGYLRAPEPATLYRMHGNMTGAYDIRHLAIRNRNVLTNKTPSGLVRGFGGPQVYFALERLMQTIAKKLGLDPLDVISVNLIAADQFPYRTASGGLYDSGNYAEALCTLKDEGHLAALKARQVKVRAAGGYYGIGYAAVVEPSISNMGYITTVLTPQEREKAGAKGGAIATGTISIDALGGVSVHVASTPQGQGHRTVLSQLVADVFGLKPDDISVNTELDTGRDAWSVASGNYSSRFAGAVAGTVHLAAQRLRNRIAAMAADRFGCKVGDIRFEEGIVHGTGRSEPFRRIAATSHWAQGTLPHEMEPVLRETAYWSPEVLTPPNADDEVNSSASHGFLFDLCGVEVCRHTGRVTVDKYVSVHDAGTLLNPALADGQVRGAFSNAIGAACYEHFDYGTDGSFRSGTFADYTVPTATEVPNIEILHLCTPSPVTPLGAKGIGEGNCMSTPVCIANAVADALDIENVELPLTPPRVLAMLELEEPVQPEELQAGIEGPAFNGEDFAVSGNGSTLVPAAPELVWRSLLDTQALKSVVPGCKSLEEKAPGHFIGQIELGVGIVKGVFDAEVRLTDLVENCSLRLSGSANGVLGSSGGEGVVTLSPEEGRTRVSYAYGIDLSGKVAAIGGRMIEGATRVLIAEFFKRLARHAAPASDENPERDDAVGTVGLQSVIARIFHVFGRRRP